MAGAGGKRYSGNFYVSLFSRPAPASVSSSLPAAAALPCLRRRELTLINEIGRPLDPGHRHHGNVVAPTYQSLTALSYCDTVSARRRHQRQNLLIVSSFFFGRRNLPVGKIVILIDR
jgi:hypothetical protein